MFIGSPGCHGNKNGKKIMRQPKSVQTTYSYTMQELKELFGDLLNESPEDIHIAFDHTSEGDMRDSWQVPAGMTVTVTKK